MTWTN